MLLYGLTPLAAHLTILACVFGSVRVVVIWQTKKKHTITTNTIHMSSLPPSTPAADEDAYRAALHTTGASTPGRVEDVIASLTFDGTTSPRRVSCRGPCPLEAFDEAPTKK